MKKAAEYLGFSIVVLLMAGAVFIYLAPHFGWMPSCPAAWSPS